MNWMEHVDALIGVMVGLLSALGVYRYRVGRIRATQMLAKGKAHEEHAEAEVKEAQARLSLDAATREWAERLIARYDAESEELRSEIRCVREEWKAEREALEEKHTRERADWQRQMAQLTAELDVLRVQVRELTRENVLLRLWLERAGVQVGSGPLSEDVLI